MDHGLQSQPHPMSSPRVASNCLWPSQCEHIPYLVLIKDSYFFIHSTLQCVFIVIISQSLKFLHFAYEKPSKSLELERLTPDRMLY